MSKNKYEYNIINDAATNYIREYAYKNGNEIYGFMKKFNIGDSNYGRIMDAAAKGKGVISHRLYGHHLIYDFPIDFSKNIEPFLEHIFSDLFTKQGIPIVPGEILEDTCLLKFCDKLKGSWNFVNGFDILAGTVAIYQGFDKFKQTFNNNMSVDDLKDFANTVGVGALEFAIAMSTCNPFLLIGGALHLVSGLKGMMNDGAVIYFKNIQSALTIEFSMNTLNIESYLKKYSIGNSLNNVSIDKSLSEIKLPYKY
ncbi:hypothetical protein [Clostridium sp.]|uniref:hypothetical protein n=1 Tax=Clostridium sp. TaxID=1506 RepID=UPI00284EE805|nr:hypothetical protein [Clostridium sp.]MDR3595063.1 hypothetical protein [Clostridium sp.]